MTKNNKTIREFVYNSHLANVVDSEFIEPTNSDIEQFFNARALVSLDEYRRITGEETERFKKEYDL